MSSARLYLIIPLFNESANLPPLFQSLKSIERDLAASLVVSFIIIDDGSTDSTSSLACQLATSFQLNLILLKHEHNSGPGRAFATAFEYLSHNLTAQDWVATMEGDNTSRADLLQQMLIRTREGYDVIMASPYLYGGGIVHTSMLRIFLSHAGNAFSKIFFGLQGFVTLSSFFRLYKGNVILHLQSHFGPSIIERSGFECMIELLIKMVLLGVPISEIPMRLDASNRKGRSKMRLFRTIGGYLSISKDIRRWRSLPHSPQPNPESMSPVK
jgi:dolichol-phosphate mannosyltransferase